MKHKDLVIIWVPREVHHKIKMKSAEKGLSMKDYLSLKMDEENKTISQAEKRFRNGLF